MLPCPPSPPLSEAATPLVADSALAGVGSQGALIAAANEMQELERGIVVLATNKHAWKIVR